MIPTPDRVRKLFAGAEMRNLSFLILTLLLVNGCGNTPNTLDGEDIRSHPLDSPSAPVEDGAALPDVNPDNGNGPAAADTPSPLPDYTADPQVGFRPVTARVFGTSGGTFPVKNLRFAIMSPGMFGASEEEVTFLPFRMGSAIIEVRIDTLSKIEVGSETRQAMAPGAPEGADPRKEVRVSLTRKASGSKPIIGWVAAEVQVLGNTNIGVSRWNTIANVKRIEIETGG